MKPHVYAHRGGRLWAPENTLAAFRLSVAAGVYGIELDVHRCKSGELVVIHDRDVASTTNGAGFVKDLTFEQLRSFSAGSRFAPQFASERIPLLSEVLAVVDGKCVLNIEVKNAPDAYPGIERDLVAALRGYKGRRRIIFSSFDHQAMRDMKRYAPQFRTALLLNGQLVDVGKYASRLGATALHPHFVNLRADHVRAAQKAGLAVNSWTLNTEAEWRTAYEWGLNGIVTDDPVGCMRFLSTLRRRRSR